MVGPLFHMGAELSTGAKRAGVMPQRHLTSEANIPELCASPVMLRRKSRLKGMMLFAIHNQELSIHTISLVPLSFTSDSDRPPRLKLMRWYQCKMSKCAKKAESCSGVNTLVVRRYCGSAFRERAGERGENHLKSLHEMLHPQDWRLQWRSKVVGRYLK